MRAAWCVAAALLLFAGAACAEDTGGNSAAATANPTGPVLLFEPFREGWLKEWVNSTESKYDGEWQWAADYSDVKGDYGAKMASPGKLHGMARKIKGGVNFGSEPIVIQYEVKAADGLACDGHYVKLLHEVQGGLKKFNSESRYTIMFGPDKCAGTDKVHFIVQYQNPISKEWEEKHAQDVPLTAGFDKGTHLYTLIVRPDNTFEILVDNQSKKKGSLLKDLEPPINPPKEIDDPADFKPDDWVDEAMIADPDAKKPADWDDGAPEMIEDASASKPSDWHDDEKEMVPDPAAVKPDDWDDDEDGDWEAPIVPNPKCKKSGCGEWKRPLIKNPAYKGKWSAPMIKNPAYKGEWKARQIPNKNFFEDKDPFKSLTKIDALAIELLTVSGGIVFDNLLITNSESAASSFAKQTWSVRNKVERAASGKTTGMMDTIKVFLGRARTAMVALYQEQPIPFAVGAVLSIFLLVVLIFSLCCGGGGDEKAGVAAATALAKKLDATGADDEEEEESESSGEDEAAPAARPSRRAAAKSDEDEGPAKKSSPKKRTSRKD